jgi:phosphoglucosamine mutase
VSKRVLFGTDGVRGKANVYPMTVEVALALGQSLGHLVNLGRLGRFDKNHRHRIIIGKDTRLSGYCFEQAIAAGICSVGVDVQFVGPLPTPGIAFITQSMRADAGVVVSASHNPFEDNGIKIFGHDGFKLPDAVELELERLILADVNLTPRPTGNHIGRAKRVDDAGGRYVVYVKSVLPNTSTLDGLKIVVDCAHGAGYKVAPDALRELGAEVITLNDKPNGLNINLDAGSLHPAGAAACVKENGAHLGIALDGDADRVVLIDELGEVVSGDALIALTADYLHQEGRLAQNTVVVTDMSNFGLDRCLNERGIQVERTQVGDRYVVERMREKSLNFGGEESGHLIWFDHGTTGDGLAAALLVISLMQRQQKPLSVLKQIIKPVPRAVRNFAVLERVPLNDLPKLQASMQRVEQELAGEGRLFMRYSGTEKKARILVEGPSQAKIDAMADELARIWLAEIA